MGHRAPDGGIATLHVRCGDDVAVPLRRAGFEGAYLAYRDPLCQGPLVDDADFLPRRAAFLAQACGVRIGRMTGDIAADLAAAEARLAAAGRDYVRVVLWCEHDSHDQIVLARCLARLAEAPPRHLDLISLDRFPEGMRPPIPGRFVGLGQLPPEALRRVWSLRRSVLPPALRAASAVWRRLCAPDPSALAALAAADVPGLPHMSGALRRHCRELPWTRDGLGLTERLILESLAEGAATAGGVFRDLTQAREPLPWLSDVLFLAIVECLQRAAHPPIAMREADPTSPATVLELTREGRAVLAGTRDARALGLPMRWVGGVPIPTVPPCWRWDEDRCIPSLT